VISQSLNPVWKETFWFEVNPADIIKVECWDEDKLSGADSMGSVELNVRHILEKGIKDDWFPMKGKRVSGSIRLPFDW
jgi:Ca2+-dependent lipid-binding protein